MHILYADTISALGLIKQVTEQLPSVHVFKYFFKVSKFTHYLIVNVARLSFSNNILRTISQLNT